MTLNDHMFRSQRQVGRHRRGSSLAYAPWRGKFRVEEQGSFELYRSQDIGKHIHLYRLVNLAFVARDAEGRPALWNRPLLSLETRMLTYADQLSCVFWSADSRWMCAVMA